MTNPLLLSAARNAANLLLSVTTARIPNRIALVQESFSGSNTFALWKLATNEFREKYDLILTSLPGEPTIPTLGSYFRNCAALHSAALVATTHGMWRPSRGQIHLHLFHAFPLKTVGVTEPQFQSSWRTYWRSPRVDYATSYSTTYNTVLTACLPVRPRNLVITGAPRNDFLFCNTGREKLENLLGHGVGKSKILFYAPTYREGYYGVKQGNKTYGNIFGFPRFSQPRFEDFLREQSCILLLKLHPHDEEAVLQLLPRNTSTNIFTIREARLRDTNTDFYEVLGACDLLITDYSSVYLDYLLLDRPVLFAPVDLQEYRQTRGLVVEPYEFWAPGPKVLDQESLQHEISKSLSRADYYRDARSLVANIIHHYKDGNSTRRVWDLIDSAISSTSRSAD